MEWINWANDSKSIVILWMDVRFHKMLCSQRTISFLRRTPVSEKSPLVIAILSEVTKAAWSGNTNFTCPECTFTWVRVEFGGGAATNPSYQLPGCQRVYILYGIT